MRLWIAEGAAHAGEELVGRDEVGGLGVDRQLRAAVGVDPARDVASSRRCAARRGRASALHSRRSIRTGPEAACVRRLAPPSRRPGGRSPCGSGPWARSRRPRRRLRCPRPDRPSRRASRAPRPRRPRERSRARGSAGPSSWAARRERAKPSRREPGPRCRASRARRCHRTTAMWRSSPGGCPGRCPPFHGPGPRCAAATRRRRGGRSTSRSRSARGRSGECGVPAGRGRPGPPG